MYKNLTRLWIILALSSPFSAFAQEQHSTCISSHFHQFYGPSDTVKVISINRLKRWSVWCQHGYTAQKLESTTRPCYEDTIETLRRQSDGYIHIGMQKTRQVKEQCRQQLWSEVIPPEYQDQS